MSKSRTFTGWAFTANSRKLHWFTAGQPRSLCRSYSYSNARQGGWTPTDPAPPDCCRSCRSARRRQLDQGA